MIHSAKVSGMLELCLCQFDPFFRGRSQLSTFMKAYTANARGRGSGTTVRFLPENQHIFLITDNVLSNTAHV